MKTWIVSLCLIVFSASIVFASPEGEIWRYTWKQRSESMSYAFLNGDTYLASCAPGNAPEECQYYKIPCGIYRGGYVCSAYFDKLNLAIATQMLYGGYGLLYSFFGLKLCIEFNGIYFIPLPPLIFQLELIGSALDIPEDHLHIMP